MTISNSVVATAPSATTLGANMSINSLTISDTVNGLGLNADGYALTIGGGGVSVGAGVPASSIAPNVVLSSNQTWTNNSSNPLSFTGAVGGAGINLTKAGTGEVILSGANTYSGTTTVSNGTLSMIGGNLPTSGISVASAATFNQTGGSISGAGTFSTNGTSTLSGVNSFTGDVFLNGGTLTVGMGNGITGNLGSSTAPATLSKTVFLTNNAVFTNTTTWNDNAGAAAVLQVVINIGSGGGTFNIPSGTTTLDDGAVAGNANNAAQLQGTGNLTKIGAGTLSLGNGTSNFGTFTGQIFVNEGTLTSGATSTNPFGDTLAGTTVASGAVLDVRAAAIGLEPITVSGTGIGGGGALISSATGGSAAGPITLVGDTGIGGAAALTLSGVISGGFNVTKLGAGTTTLANAANAYTGSTTISQGTLIPSVVGGLPVGTDVIFTGGTLDPANLTHTVASISGFSGSINQGTAGTGVLRTVQSTATEFDGTVNRVNVTMSGTGSLTLGGTVDNNSASVTVESGTVILAKGNIAVTTQAVHAAATGGLTINGGTVQLAGNYDNVNSLGTVVNLAPVGINTATYGDLIYNAVGVVLNAGTLDMNGRQEAINTLTNPAGAGGTVTNTAAGTEAKLYIGHQNGTSTFGGAIADGAGTVAIEKIGTGTLTLAGANSYSGSTVVTAGRLNLQSNAANSSFSVNAGASLGGEAAMANLTLNGGTVFFDPTTVGALTTGLLTVNGTNTLDLTSIPNAGTVTAINYATLAGGGAFSLANAASYRTAPVVGDTGSAITVTFAAGKNLTWTGSASTTWNAAGAVNWNDTTPAPDVFFATDAVTFPEGGSNTSITLSGLLVPAGVIVNATTTPYTFTATAGNQIIGPTGITKTGNGTLTLNGANAYTGQTSIGGGTVAIDGTNSIGSGTAGNTIALSGGGRLQYTTAAALDLGVNRTITVGAGGGAIAYNSAAVATITVSGNLIGSGADNLSFQSEAAAAGTFILTGNNSGYTGKISVDAPTVGAGGLTVLRIGSQSAVPAGGSITLNYPVGGATGNSVTLDLPTIALPAAVTLNMTSFQNGGISLRSSITSTGISSIGGTITAAGSAIVQISPPSGSTLTLNGNISEGGGGFTGTFFVRGTGNGVVNGQVNLPNGNFSKTDGGAWTINSTGNVWANTLVALGTVNLGAAGALPATAPLTLGQNDPGTAVFNLNGFNQTVASLASNPTVVGANTTAKSITSATAATLTVNTTATTTYASAINGAVSLVKDGTGTLTLLGTSGTTGTTTIKGGILNVNANAALGAAASAVAINNNATLQAGGAVSTSARTVTLGSGGGTIDTNGNTVTLDVGSTVTGTTLTKIGNGKLVLAGTQTYSTLDTEAGRTDLASALGTGTSSIIANAETNTSVSQTLASLTIGNGAVFTLSSPLPLAPALAEASDFSDASSFGSGELVGPSVASVPEPGSIALLFGGVLALLGRRRRA